MRLPPHLTIDNFLNPLGMAGSSKIIRDQLTVRYVKNINKGITIVDVFKNKDNYIFHLSIPSEKNFQYVSPVFYDVIVEFYPFEAAHLESKKVDKYGIRVFSNCPTFIFNFTYVYGKMGSLFNLVPTDHYSELALKEPPDIANPYRILGIEKSIFYAITKIRLESGLVKNKIDGMLSKKQDDKDFQLSYGYFTQVTKSQTIKLSEVKEAEAGKIVVSKKKGVGVLELKEGNRTVASVGHSGKKNTGDRGKSFVTDMKRSNLNENKLKQKKAEEKLVKKEMKSDRFKSSLNENKLNVKKEKR